jgi:hypothetical protein
MQLITVAGGDGRIFAASASGGRFFYVSNPDNLVAGQLAGTYSQEIHVLDEGQVNHVKYACIEQQDYAVGQTL